MVASIQDTLNLIVGRKPHPTNKNNYKIKLVKQ